MKAWLSMLAVAVVMSAAGLVLLTMAFFDLEVVGAACLLFGICAASFMLACADELRGDGPPG